MVLRDLLSLHEHRGFVMSHRDFLQPPGSVRFSRSASRDKIRVTAEEVLPCREGKTTSKTWTLSNALICHWSFLCCSFLSAAAGLEALAITDQLAGYRAHLWNNSVIALKSQEVHSSIRVN